MQRRNLLKTLDPVNSKSVNAVLTEMRAMKTAYVDMVLNNRHADDLGLNKVLEVYESFHHLTRKDS